VKSKISVLIAEDHALVRAGVRALLDFEPDMEVIGEAITGEDAANIVRERSPDIVLMDLNLPGGGGLLAIKEIKKCAPDVKILVVTMHKTDEYIHEALRNGASGYILKESAHSELIFAMRRVLEGKTYVSPDVAEVVIANISSTYQKAAPTPVATSPLTPRELEVLKLVAQGYSNKQVADRMNLSIKTIEKHRSSVMKKLNLRNTVMLASYAIKNGHIKV